MIIALNPGQLITPIRVINRTMVSHWKYAAENADVGGGLLPGAELTITEVSKRPGHLWVRAELPGRSPPATLKISGEEYALNFRLTR
jgi:hypothetical protein